MGRMVEGSGERDLNDDMLEEHGHVPGVGHDYGDEA